MSTLRDKLVQWLFDTKAVRICPENKPFWYTSGTIGPYYINTHFLYGSEEKANTLLNVIDNIKSDKLACPEKLLELLMHNYENDSIYTQVMDAMADYIKSNIDVKEVQYISGGERRDWFFSLIIAHLLNKPHIAIYKDLSTVMTVNGKTSEFDDLKGAKVLHIADLITEASSYERAWIPAIKKKNGSISWSVVVVDRKQGGDRILADRGVKSFAMISIDRNLFDRALSMGYINEEQHKMVMEYMKDPKEFIRQFLAQHPEFIENALNSDEKTRERAKLFLNTWGQSSLINL